MSESAILQPIDPLVLNLPLEQLFLASYPFVQVRD
jgi:hypothetical protein